MIANGAATATRGVFERSICPDRALIRISLFRFAAVCRNQSEPVTRQAVRFITNKTQLGGGGVVQSDEPGVSWPPGVSAERPRNAEWGRKSTNDESNFRWFYTEIACFFFLGGFCKILHPFSINTPSSFKISDSNESQPCSLREGYELRLI